MTPTSGMTVMVSISNGARYPAVSEPPRSSTRIETLAAIGIQGNRFTAQKPRSALTSRDGDMVRSWTGCMSSRSETGYAVRLGAILGHRRFFYQRTLRTSRPLSISPRLPRRRAGAWGESLKCKSTTLLLHFWQDCAAGRRHGQVILQHNTRITAKGWYSGLAREVPWFSAHKLCHLRFLLHPRPLLWQ